MSGEKMQAEPVVASIKGGWVAHGDGWAVHAPTREEAVAKFHETQRRNQEIDARPFWYERQ